MSYHPILLAALSSVPLPLRNGTLLALLLFLVYFGFFLLPGFAAATLVFRGNQGSPTQPVIVTVASSAALGLLAFWAFFLDKTLGRSFCFAIYIASALLLGERARRGMSFAPLLRAVRTPFLFAGGAGLLYTALLFLPSKSVASDPEFPASRFFAEGRPGDNLIPLFLADRFYDQRPIRPFCCGGWLSSDRPPLQSGVFLLERPLRVLGGNWLHYQLLATALQCLWVCGVWCLLAALGASETRTKQILAFLIPSGFLFYNSVYTWPKLFASALTLFAISILVRSFREERSATLLEVCTGAFSFGLALLAHPGSVFSLPAFGVLALRYRRLITIRQLTLAVSIVVGLMLPWCAYQRWVDPPGDRLLKMHLGGEPDPTPQSTWQVVRDAYSRHAAAEIVCFKLSNLGLLVGRSPLDLLGLNAIQFRPKLHVDHAAAEQSRVAQREYIWNALGVLNIGWIVGLGLALRSRCKSALPFGGWLVSAALVNLVIWALVMFGPGATVTTHSSYADVLLLAVGLFGWILTLPKYAVASVFLLEAVSFLVIWVWPR